MMKGQDSTNGAAIVYIDSNGGEAANIGPIDLINNLIFSDVTDDSHHSGEAQDGQYGVAIGTCAAVTIIGGQISQMGGNEENPTTGSANICIFGDPDSVLIDSVNLSATYAGANHGESTGANGSGPSYYGLLINGSPVSVVVANCNFTGVTVPISVSGSR